MRVSARLWAAATAVLLVNPTIGAAQVATVACGPGDAPFLSAASEIGYGCGYLLESAAPQFVLAEGYFRRALELEPRNAIARALLALAYAGQGRAEQARAALAEAAAVDTSILRSLEGVFERRPALRAVLEGALTVDAPAATLPPVARADDGAAPETPSTPAAPATPVAPVFAVGTPVEIQYRADEWFPGVVTSVDPGSCPYYRVEADVYGNGNPSNLGYGCGSVRAPTGIGPTVAACGGSNPNCPPTSPPPTGSYTCDVVSWDVAAGRARFSYQGYVELLSGGRYRWLDDGGTGTYSYDPKTHAVTWRSGPLESRGGSAVYGLDGTTPEITITFETDFTRRTGNEPVRWQCGHKAR